MSGGVDSSVAAMLLRDQGYETVGVFMRSYNLDGCAERDAEDARRVAEALDIPFYVWDFEEEYKRRVVDYMIDGYRKGITPNPDVMCNKEIKFGLFLEKALAAGADYVATGHYVRLGAASGAAGASGSGGARRAGDARLALYAAKDGSKDQSYFLWTLTQAQLERCLFPIGDHLKSEVRTMAAKAGLSTAAKKDSQGICFLGEISIAEFLKEYIPEHRGELVTTSGERIGEHFGAEFYTIGERHIDADFKFPKTGSASARKPFYVAEKDLVTNRIVVAEGSDHPALYRKKIEVMEVNEVDATRTGRVFARVRYRQPLAAASVTPGAKGTATIEFDEPQKFVSAGQSAVWYAEDGELLGGGVIR